MGNQADKKVCNVWPKEDLPELEAAFKDLGKLQYEVGLLMVKHLDRFVKSKNEKYPDNHIKNNLSEENTIGRLLFYYPGTLLIFIKNELNFNLFFLIFLICFLLINSSIRTRFQLVWLAQ